MPTIVNTNPTTEETQSYETTDAGEIAELFDQASSAYLVWSSQTIEARVAALKTSLEQLRSQAPELATLISSEMGKPILLAEREIARTVEEFSFLLDHADAWLTDEPVSDGYVNFAPLGVTLVISPWNFPLMLPLRAITAALVAGNSVIFKPSELTPRCGSAIQELFTNLGGPLQTVIGGRELGQALVALPVRLVAFTGSTVAGQWIAKEAASSLKRLVLELGGLDAAIVLKDAEIERAASGILNANSGNSGQVCNAVKRVYVEQEIYPEFLAAVAELSKKLKVGDPLNRETEMGPIVSANQLARVESFLTDAVGKGAEIVTGGRRLKRKGFFFEHTVLTNVPKEARLLSEEPFGPILPVIKVADWREAVKEANNSCYGLMGSVWTRDLSLGEKICRQLDVGTACVNSHFAGPPGTPWGGAKQSGLGRMKTKEGLREFTNVRLVRLNK